MKKLIVILCFLIPIIGIASLAGKSSRIDLENTDISVKAHWFRLSNGTYLGYFDITDLQPICGQIAIVDCTIGFEHYDFDNNEPLSDAIILEGDYEF